MSKIASFNFGLAIIYGIAGASSKLFGLEVDRENCTQVLPAT